MKIKNIEREEEYKPYFRVTFTPNWFRKLFGVKEKTKRYKDTGSIYRFGGGTVYIDENYKQLGDGNKIGVAIDNFRHPF